MVLQAHGLCQFQRTIKETLREKASEHQLENDTEIETKSNSDNLCNPVDDKEVGDIRQIVNPRLDSFHTDKEVEKKSATLLVPGSVRRYKYTVIAELRNNPELFTDRLRRVWGAGTSMESEKAGDSGSRDSNDSVGLFATVCLTTLPALANSYWAEYKKGTKGLIECVCPIDISNKPPNVKVIVSKYCRTSEDSHLYYHQETVVAMPLTSLICKVHLEINQEEERKDDFFALRHEHVEELEIYDNGFKNYF